MSDHKGARLILATLQPASHLIADRGYDSTWFRQELEARGIEPCIPSSRSRKVPYACDTALYRQRHKVENLFAKLKDWRRIATRYDGCAHTFFSAICIAAAVISGSNEIPEQVPNSDSVARKRSHLSCRFKNGKTCSPRKNLCLMSRPRNDRVEPFIPGFDINFLPPVGVVGCQERIHGPEMHERIESETYLSCQGVQSVP
jgi:transposase